MPASVRPFGASPSAPSPYSQPRLDRQRRPLPPTTARLGGRGQVDCAPEGAGGGGAFFDAPRAAPQTALGLGGAPPGPSPSAPKHCPYSQPRLDRQRRPHCPSPSAPLERLRPLPCTAPIHSRSLTGRGGRARIRGRRAARGRVLPVGGSLSTVGGAADSDRAVLGGAARTGRAAPAGRGSPIRVGGRDPGPRSCRLLRALLLA